MKKFTFHAYTRGGMMALWVGVPAVFAVAAALLVVLLFAFRPDLSPTYWMALIIIGIALLITWPVLIYLRRKLYHLYTFCVSPGLLRVERDGEEISNAKVYQVIMQESETDSKSAVLNVYCVKKHYALHNYDKKAMFHCGTQEDYYQMELAYFEMKKHLPKADRAGR